MSPSATPASRPLRVLLVDDHQEARAAMAKYLSLSGLDVTEAANGAAAIAALQAGPPFRALLTDLSLPDIDGYEVAHRAREISPATWIALITGWSVDTDDALNNGVSEVFLKPVNLGELCQAIKERVAANDLDVTDEAH